LSGDLNAWPIKFLTGTELAHLGYNVAELTVAKYMRRTARRPSPTWRTFLAVHARDIVAVDFLSGSIVRYLAMPPQIRASGFPAHGSSEAGLTG
jgi:hypothetical protein